MDTNIHDDIVNIYVVVTVFFFCRLVVAGGEGPVAPWAQLVHAAPHSGLLRSGRSGSAARPGETLRNDPEEEEDAAAQQEEEMKEHQGETPVIWTWTRTRTCVCDTFEN